MSERQSKFELLIIRNKPAVTKVEECTREEIGVGAAIAAGSQGEKGNKADLVDKVKNKRRAMSILAQKGDKYTKCKEEESNHKNTTKRIKRLSPTRFIKIVKELE